MIDAQVDVPESPRSTFSTLSTASSSPIALRQSTLALIDEFFADKAEEERRFQELVGECAAASVAGLALDASSGRNEEKPIPSVDEYRISFGEDWQLSQFWYSSAFANQLARCIHKLCTPTSSVAFMCCPTAFVAFQHMKRHANTKLLEYDQRFAVLSPREFIPYDLNEPDVFPADLKESIDIAIADPPFLNKITNEKLARTLGQILHPTRGKLLLLTSTSVQPILDEVYSTHPLGPLRKTALVVEHGQLANDFACWGSWEAAQIIGKNEHSGSGVSD